MIIFFSFWLAYEIDVIEESMEADKLMDFESIVIERYVW